MRSSEDYSDQGIHHLLMNPNLHQHADFIQYIILLQPETDLVVYGMKQMTAKEAEYVTTILQNFFTFPSL